MIDFLPTSSDRATMEIVAKAEIEIGANLRNLRPKDALGIARMILENLVDNGFSYADYQSAQATQKYVKQAVRALEGLSL